MVRHGRADGNPDCYENVGNVFYEPASFNIVPRIATSSLEFRAPNTGLMQHLRGTLLKKAKEAAESRNLGVEIELLGDRSPATMGEQVQALIVSSAEYLGLESMSLQSGPGHDAQAFADLRPTGMVFAPSIDGASHSPREKTAWKDYVNSANVLLPMPLCNSLFISSDDGQASIKTAANKIDSIVALAMASLSVVHGMVAAIMLHAGQLWLGRTSE